MSLVSADLYGAIYNKYANTGALNTLTADTSSMWLGQVEPGHETPYIVVSIISILPIYTFGNLTTPIEEAAVSFTVVDQALSHAGIMGILDQLEAAYGINTTGLTFTSSTYSLIESERTNMVGPDRMDGIWQATADYIFRCKKL